MAFESWTLPSCGRCKRRSKNTTNRSRGPRSLRAKALWISRKSPARSKRAALALAGLHPATGGTGAELCSGDMLLEALVACAGVTLKAVSTALEIPLRNALVKVEGDLDFRARSASARRRLSVSAPSASPSSSTLTQRQQKIDQLLKLTERYSSFPDS